MGLFPIGKNDNLLIFGYIKKRIVWSASTFSNGLKSEPIIYVNDESFSKEEIDKVKCHG